jgi:hypothetical protein
MLFGLNHILPYPGTTCKSRTLWKVEEAYLILKMNIEVVLCTYL